MKRTTWKKQHKWLGIGFSFFMLMFCVSGIILNHREEMVRIGINRKWLPESYQFNQWNRGLLKGTFRYTDIDSTDMVLIYGNSGIWRTDTKGSFFEDFNSGWPAAADLRNIRGCVVTPDHQLWAAGQFGLYHYDEHKRVWYPQVIPLAEKDRISDLTCAGDTMVVVGRSFLYVAVAPFVQWDRMEVAPPDDYDGKVSLFRTVWSLHNGELFGSWGKLLMDVVAVIIILLTCTGLIYWLLPKFIHKRKSAGKSIHSCTVLLKDSLNWHDRLGRYTFGLLLFVAFTGWCLRPPMLIALVSARVPAIPFTVMDDTNAWRDRLRMMRFDEEYGDWLLSSSEGIYVLSSLTDKPVRLKKVPPISVMGLNVWQKNKEGNWLMGSFSGMFVWNRKKQLVKDYFTGEISEEVSGPPFGKFAVSGYSDDFGEEPIVVEYNKGISQPFMPEKFSCLPISLWNLALEVHSGRIYTILGPVTLIFIFFAGAVALWCLSSGYIIRKRKKARP